MREALSKQYDLGSREPDIQVWSVNLRGDRSLTLRHTRHNNRPLHDGAQEVLKHVARLWGFGVNLESVDQWGDVELPLVDRGSGGRRARLTATATDRPSLSRSLGRSSRSGRAGAICATARRSSPGS